MGVEQADDAHEDEQRQDQQHQREHVDQQELQHQEPLAAKVEAREGVGRGHRQREADHDRPGGDDEAVEQVGAEADGAEQPRVVLQRRAADRRPLGEQPRLFRNRCQEHPQIGPEREDEDGQHREVDDQHAPQQGAFPERHQRTAFPVRRR
jgi:hypothetical protein